MSGSKDSTHTQAHFAISGTYGTVQLAARDRVIVLQTIGRNYDIEGFLHIDTAQMRIPIAVAFKLHEALGRAIVAAEAIEDTRQTALWSDATVRAVAARLGAA
jgi:hypothetical protein